MLIGIISKPAHSKNHVAALQKEGYSVLNLGSSPTEVPPSVDLLVLRTQSCSHGGSDTAYYWNRATKKPLIVENGLSGIRNQLRKFAHLSNRAKSPNPTNPAEESQSMLNFTGTLPRDFAPAFPDFPKNGKLPWELRAVPWNRLEKAFRETLGLYQSMSPEIVTEIRSTFRKGRSTFRKGRLSRGQHPYFSSIDSWAARQVWAITTHLGKRPLHFFLFLQWCLQDTGEQPTVAELQYAYANFCGSSSMKSYVTAAVWVVRNQILMGQEVPNLEVPNLEVPAQVNDDYMDHLFDEVIGVSPPADCEGGSGSGEVLEASPKAGEDFSRIRRDLEDFVLEFAANGQEILSLVKSLREEVAALREEVATLKNPKSPPGSSDPLHALLTLRDQGAQISLAFGPKS